MRLVPCAVIRTNQSFHIATYMYFTDVICQSHATVVPQLNPIPLQAISENIQFGFVVKNWKEIGQDQNNSLLDCWPQICRLQAFCAKNICIDLKHTSSCVALDLYDGCALG